MEKRHGRPKGVPNKHTLVKRQQTVDFFRKIMSDKKEETLWEKFLTGADPNIVNWQAFKRAVEYKRGMPVQTHTGEDGAPIAIQVVTNAVFIQR